MGMMLNRRRIMGGKTLPYDAEIEYLESLGDCYIKTNYIPTGKDIHVNTKFLYNGYTNNANWINWFTTYIDEKTNVFRIIRNTNTNTSVLLYNGTIANGGGVKFDVSIGDIYIIDFNRNRYEINGRVGGLLNNFGMENSDTISIFSEFFKGRCYYFRLLNNDIIELDLIPVRVDTTGFMYDKVSGKLFGNAGTGAFILGPDK